MILIKFAVNNQRLRKITPSIIPPTASIVKCEFNFRTNDWSGISKTVNFYCNGENYTAELDEYNMCTVPPEVLATSFKVFVFGGDIATNSISVYIDDNQAIEPTAYQELLRLIREHTHNEYITEEEIQDVLPGTFDAGKIIERS